MSSINSVRNLQILYFSKKNKKIKNLKNGEKKWRGISISIYYCLLRPPPSPPFPPKAKLTPRLSLNTSKTTY